jgi:hypothetical protein
MVLYHYFRVKGPIVRKNIQKNKCRARRMRCPGGRVSSPVALALHRAQPLCVKGLLGHIPAPFKCLKDLYKLLNRAGHRSPVWEPQFIKPNTVYFWDREVAEFRADPEFDWATKSNGYEVANRSP